MTEVVFIVRMRGLAFLQLWIEAERKYCFEEPRTDGRYVVKYVYLKETSCEVVACIPVSFLYISSRKCFYKCGNEDSGSSRRFVSLLSDS
jgi:hypothetical protein